MFARGLKPWSYYSYYLVPFRLIRNMVEMSYSLAPGRVVYFPFITSCGAIFPYESLPLLLCLHFFFSTCYFYFIPFPSLFFIFSDQRFLLCGVLFQASVLIQVLFFPDMNSFGCKQQQLCMIWCYLYVFCSYFKSERVKQLLNQGHFRPLLFNDPLAALQRDSFAAAEARVDEAEIRSIANQQMATLDNLVIQQRRSQMRLARILRDAEERHRKVWCSMYE
jgi:hypothetical protein